MQTILAGKIKDIKLAKEEVITITLHDLDGDQLETLRRIKEGGTAHILFSSSQLDIDDYRPAVPQRPEGIKFHVNSDGTAEVESKEDDGQMTIDQAAEQEDTAAEADGGDDEKAAGEGARESAVSDDPMHGVDDEDPDEKEESDLESDASEDDLPGLDTEDDPGF
ncbi:hypothetical protein [Paenibacillus xanthanilyticus]|uniref:Uncharacterized protein n=1 Tax=Paenibacillus xanthanilyticus TaxID=1783531 RepID=A0ABV8K9Y6_9BACL